jgi:hypothetical protein
MIAHAAVGRAQQKLHRLLAVNLQRLPHPRNLAQGARSTRESPSETKFRRRIGNFLLSAKTSGFLREAKFFGQIFL